MAFRAGKDAFIRIDGVAAAPINVSAYADNFSFPRPVDTYEVSTFGSTPKAFIPGLTEGGQVGMSGPLDVAMGTFAAAIMAAQAAGSSSYTIEYSPGGSVAGQLKVSAEAYITAFDISTGVGGRAEYSSSWQLTGAVTSTTW
jgi:hypothetical protein